MTATADSAETSGSPGATRAGLITVQFLFGVHYLAAKVIVAEMDPAAWAVLRSVSAAVVMLGLVVLLRRRLPARRDLLILGGCAVFGVTLNQAIFLEAIARTTPAHAALICAQIPGFSLLFAVLLKQERATWRKGGCFLLGMAGVLVLLEVDRFDAGSETLSGDLLCVLGAMSYGLFLVISRRPMLRNDPVPATAVVFVVGAVLLLFYGGDELLAADLSGLSGLALASMAYAALGATVLAYFLNLWALKRTDSSRVALYIFLQPVIAALLGIWWLGDAVTPRFVVATVLVFAALALRDRPPRPAVSSA